MKIKTKELRRKCQPWVDDCRHRLHNQSMLLTELYRRNNWRLRVIEACDNFKEIFKPGVPVDLDRIIFPSHRRINPRIGTWGYLFNPNRNKYHIIRQGKHKLRIVKAKKKPQKYWLRSVEFDISNGYFRELGGKWYRMTCYDFGCDACDVQSFCRMGHHEQSFCGIARFVGFTLHGNCWKEVVDDEKSAVEYTPTTNNTHTDEDKNKHLKGNKI